MQISVVIPTHNRDDLLKHAIDSALKQRQLPVEIIVVDDVPNESNEKSLRKFLRGQN